MVKNYFVVSENGQKRIIQGTNYDLKILPEYFESVICNKKNFELRKDDRNFRVGDRVGLEEFDGGKYTGRTCIVEIKYVLRNCSEYGLKNGYCIFGW